MRRRHRHTLLIVATVAAYTTMEEKIRAAVTAATEVADRYGFDSTQTVVDRPGDHQVRLSNYSTGAHTDFGTAVNVILSTITGCNLPDGPLPTMSPPGG